MDEPQALRDLLWTLLGDPGTGALIALLLMAAVIDWTTLRIPNWLTVGGRVSGLLYNASHATSVGAGLGHTPWSLMTPAPGAWRPGAAATPSAGKVPYAVGIRIGGVAFLVARQLGFV